MKKTVALVGTLDTKGEEYLYVKKLLQQKDLEVLTVHTGVFKAQFKPDIDNAVIAEAAGVTIAELVERKDRAFATEKLAQGLKEVLPELYKKDKFQGVLSFGGSGGTSLVTPAMQKLPIGVPKIMVSTMAAGDVTPYVGTSDIIMIPSIVDVAGLNSISTKLFTNAVYAISGMLTTNFKEEVRHKPLIAASMFGVTTPAVTVAREFLEQSGYEVLVFHTTGTGGKIMESLVQDGFIEGVLDLTITEWADELFGGVLSAGPTRLEAAALTGTPQVVSVGALDMVNFGPIETVPEKYKQRNLYQHNPTITLMRTTKAENQQLGEKIAEKLNLSTGKTVLILPLKGISAIDVEGQPFYGPIEDQQLFKSLKENLTNPLVKIIQRDEAINDSTFAQYAAEQLINLIENK